MWPFRRRQESDEPRERGAVSRILRRESAKEILQDSLQGFIAYPKATYLGIRQAQVKFAQMSAFDRTVDNWEMGAFLALFLIGIVFLLTFDGTNFLLRLGPLVVVGFLWFGRVVGWNPVRSFIQKSLVTKNEVGETGADPARPKADPAVSREIMALLLGSALVELRQWDKRPRRERLDQAPALAFAFMNTLVKCADLLEYNDIDGAMNLIKNQGQGDGSEGGSASTSTEAETPAAESTSNTTTGGIS